MGFRQPVGQQLVTGADDQVLHPIQAVAYGGVGEAVRQHGVPERFAADARHGAQMTYTELRHYIQSLRSRRLRCGALERHPGEEDRLSADHGDHGAARLSLCAHRRTPGRGGGPDGGHRNAIAYWSSSSLLEALGNLNQLPAGLAAWTPDVLFLGLGMYLLLGVPT